MALLLLRHAVTVNEADEDGDESNVFTVSRVWISCIWVLGFSILLCLVLYLSLYWLHTLSDAVQLFLLRATGFLLPCYIMAWAISIMQRRRQRQVRNTSNSSSIKVHDLVSCTHCFHQQCTLRSQFLLFLLVHGWGVFYMFHNLKEQSELNWPTTVYKDVVSLPI